MKSGVNLHDYDLVLINSSAGKDSLVALWDICRQAKAQHYPLDRIVVSHQDFGKMEWLGTKELVKQQADLFGVRTVYSHRVNFDGETETLLAYVLRRGKWPSNSQRFCTSDFKRAPGNKVLRALSPGNVKAKVLQVFGFRHEESPARAKKQRLVLNEDLSTKNGNREVWDYCPVLTWPLAKVWRVIRLFKLPYHFAYDLGMPRLSCCFCIFSPFDALVIAGIHNYRLLKRYARVELWIGHRFRMDVSLQDVVAAIDAGYRPARIKDWVM